MVSLIDIPIGSIVHGRQGNEYRVIGIDADQIILEFPDGSHKRVLQSVIHRWELPPNPLEHSSIEVDGIAHLKGTKRKYRVIRMYQVFRGQDSYEQWAELEGPCGAAFWPVEQLEVA